MVGPLSAEELRFYEENGYLIPSYRLGKDEVEELAGMAARLVADNPELVNKVIQAPHIRTGDDGGLQSNGEILRYAVHPDLLDMIEQIIGPDLVLWTTSLFHKSGLSGPATPWHQDGVYWPMKPVKSCSYWIAVTESRRDNACMRVIPGSHHGEKVVPHLKTEGKAEFALTLDPAAFDEDSAVDIELEPGQMLLFHPFLIHGSHSNEGVRVRTGFSARFMPSYCYFNHDNEYEGKIGYADRALMLVRGKDLCGRNDFVRNHPPKEVVG